MISSVVLANLIRRQLVRQLSVSSKYCNKTEEHKDFTHFGFETVKSSEKAEKGEHIKNT